MVDEMGTAILQNSCLCGVSVCYALVLDVVFDFVMDVICICVYIHI